MATVRDLAIIIVAIESIFILAALVILIIQVIGLVRFLKEEVKPLLTSAKETMGNVQGTADFMSENLVTPAIEMSAKVASARAMWNTAREVLTPRSFRRKP